MAATATLRPSGAFPATVMTGITHVTPSIPRLVCVELLEGLLTASGHRSPVTMSRIIAIIYVTIEAMRTVEPRASSNEKAAIKTNQVHSSRKENSYRAHSHNSHKDNPVLLLC
jgi:hypothetical protein